jgi:hypothetical protein
MKLHPTFYKDGAISDETERAIVRWRKPYSELLAFLEECFDKEHGKVWRENGFWCFATGGWSNNEHVLQVASRNTKFWECCLVKTAPGGLYVFKPS